MHIGSIVQRSKGTRLERSRYEDVAIALVSPAAIGAEAAAAAAAAVVVVVVVGTEAAGSTVLFPIRGGEARVTNSVGTGSLADANRRASLATSGRISTGPPISKITLPMFALSVRHAHKRTQQQRQKGQS